MTQMHMHVGWRRWRHRLAHWLHQQPCELLEVREDGRVLVLLCTDCGEVMYSIYEGTR